MNKERLLKLADFIERVDSSHFNLRFYTENLIEQPGKIYRDLLRIKENPELPGNCGTVACACGWLPAVFPDHFEWFGPTGILHCVTRHNYISGAVEDFFDIDGNDFHYLFMPNSYSPIDWNNGKVVASRIYKFCEGAINEKGISSTGSGIQP